MFLRRITTSVSCRVSSYNVVNSNPLSNSNHVLESPIRWLSCSQSLQENSFCPAAKNSLTADILQKFRYKSIFHQSNPYLNGYSGSSPNFTRSFSSTLVGIDKKEIGNASDIDEEAEKKLGYIQRYKLLMKRYGYVCFPVHFAIAPFWYGSFYMSAKMGVDIMPLLNYIGVVPLIEQLSPSLVEKLHSGDAGNHLVALALYKVSAPVRYMATLGASTYVINYLKFHGYIKPMTKKNIQGAYDNKKEEFQEIYEDKKEEFAQSKKQIQVMYKDKKEEFDKSRKRLRRIYEIKRTKFQRGRVNILKNDVKKKVLNKVKNGKNGRNGKK